MLLRAQLAVLVVLVVLDIWLGMDKALYASVWWWDMPSHYLGGIWVGLFAAWLYKEQKQKITILKCAVFALAIGIAWEIFESVEEVGKNPFMPYWADTAKDILLDTLGGVTAGFMAHRIIKVWRK